MIAVTTVMIMMMTMMMSMVRVNVQRALPMCQDLRWGLRQLIATKY